MSDDIITIKRSELRSVLRVFAQEFTQELGIRTKPVDSEWISKNEATKINPKRFGRKRLETAIEKGLVRKMPGRIRETKYAKILVCRADVENLIKTSTLL